MAFTKACISVLSTSIHVARLGLLREIALTMNPVLSVCGSVCCPNSCLVRIDFEESFETFPYMHAAVVQNVARNFRVNLRF